MKSFKINALLLILSGIVFISLDMCTYTVDETEKVALFRFEKPVGETSTPGLHIKIPWYSVSTVEKRWFIYDSNPRTVITNDKKNIVIDEFGICKIGNTTQFLQAVKSKENGMARIDDTIFSAVRQVIGTKDYHQIVVSERDNILDEITRRANVNMEKYFVSTGMVRISRVDLPDENKSSAYKRMSAEREREAQGFISGGVEEAQGIISSANREATEIIALAEQDSKTIRGKADGEAARIYNESYGKNPEFFMMYRGLETAKSTLGRNAGTDTRLILNGKEKFLKNLLE